MYNLKKIQPATFVLPQEGKMQVPGLVIATEELIREMDLEEPLKQVKNVAELPGILGYSIAMPDIHWGYGFPIGGVAAMDARDGVISPGGVGYDINCGVRLATLDIPFASIGHGARKRLLDALFRHIPSGVGKGQSRQTLSDADYKLVASKGALFAINQGYGLDEDVLHTESRGVIKGADMAAVSETAKERGRGQLGSIGSGNHFVEVGSIDTLYLPEVAEAWNIKKGATYILIHSGSRGFGHQICQDTLDLYMKKGFAQGLKDRQLVSAPIQSPEGKHYFAAMAAAANFAFCNRQMILHEVREAFREALGVEKTQIKLLYDVCHNIAKFEKHPIGGKLTEVCVHRKGATRAFGKGHPELPPLFQDTGQPVLVPGDMGRASHILVGKGNPTTFCSCCHGAGRAKSRIQSEKAWKGKDPLQYMQSKGVSVKASSMKTILEEMPDAYKDVDEVVLAVQEAGLADMVAKLKPALVVKG